MKWKKFTLTTTTEAVDLVSSMFDDIGIEGIEIEDNIPLTEKETKGMFIDILPELPPDEGIAKVSFYLDDDADVAEMLKKVNEGLDELALFTDLGARTIEASETEDKDWINNWKQYFHPIPVGEKLLIRPTWEEAYDPQGRTVLHLEPGLAFGTGTHETTRLCLELLEKYLKPGMSLLDVGCGSGILSVAGLLLGAEKAVGVDIDALAVKTAGENAQTNGVEEKFQGICGNLTDQVAGKYELVVANIVADIIILLTKDITRYLNPDSIYLMSGIIDTRVQEVRDALEPRFTILEERQEKGWFALAAKQKS